VHRATKKYLSKPAKSRWYNQSYQGSFCCVLNETNRNKMSHLYEKDYANWAEIMANLLAEKQFDELDIDNLVEEIKDLSKRERDQLISSIRLIIHHLLKWKYQPQKRSRSWQITIERERNNIDLYLEDSPSLRQYLASEWVNKAHRIARLDAAKETDLNFPKECPFTIEEILDFNYFPASDAEKGSD